MTGTTCERKFIDGVAETIPNHVLEALLYQNFAEVGVPQHTPEEMAFATELATTYDAGRHIPGSGSENADYAARVKTLLPGTAMNDVLLPLFTGEAFCPGSTDVGDVSWQCPTAQLHVASWPNGCPGHSWQNVSCGKTSIGHKAAITAGKVLCAAAIDLLEQPELIAAAKTEFAGRTAEGYTCPIPPEARAYHPGLIVELFGFLQTEGIGPQAKPSFGRFQRSATAGPPSAGGLPARSLPLNKAQKEKAYLPHHGVRCAFVLYYKLSGSIPNLSRRKCWYSG